MVRFLLYLYPTEWRQQYGDEYAALLEDTGTPFEVLVDSIKTALSLRLRAHADIFVTLSAIAFYCVSGITCLRLGLTKNWPLWAPSNPLRAAGLFVTFVPLLIVAYIWLPPVYARLRQRHDRAYAIVRFIALLPLHALIILLSAWMGGSLLIGLSPFSLLGPTGSAPPEIHPGGNVHITQNLAMHAFMVLVIFPLGVLIIKVLLALQSYLMRRFSV